MNRILYATVGLPYSGKSTWARQQGIPIVEPDAIRYAMYGQRFLQQAEPWVWTMAHTMVRSLFYAGHNAVILDSTHTKRKRREPWMSDEWDTEFVVFDTPRRVCRERAYADEDTEILPIIERMSAEYEPLEAA